MHSLKIKKIFFQTLFATLVLSISFSVFEPDTLSAQSSASDIIRVTLVVDGGISINSPIDVTMPTHLSMYADTSVGSTTWNVKTQEAGYVLTVKASTTPAMRQSSTTTIADYTPSVGGTPETWSVTGAVEFGFSAYGNDVNTGTWGTGNVCDTGGDVPSTNKKWLNFSTTSSPTVATRNATTSVSGENTVVCFGVEQDGSYAPSGTYIADITATATAI